MGVSSYRTAHSQPNPPSSTSQHPTPRPHPPDAARPHLHGTAAAGPVRHAPAAKGKGDDRAGTRTITQIKQSNRASEEPRTTVPLAPHKEDPSTHHLHTKHTHTKHKHTNLTAGSGPPGPRPARAAALPPLLPPALPLSLLLPPRRHVC